MTTPYYEDDLVALHEGKAVDVAAALAPGSVRTIVTSPPYFGLRDYGHEDQLGAEASVGEYVANLVALFAALRPALTDDGTLWLNLGDSYAGTGYGNHSINGDEWKAAAGLDRRQSRQQTLKKALEVEGIRPKNLIGVPWRVAFALQADGWILRSDIIWAKPNPMPESVTDRPTKAHEYLFLFAKQPRYYYDAEAIAEQLSESSRARLAQPGLGEQAGSTRANGGAKTNGAMKAVGPRFGGAKYGDVGDGGADDKTRTKSGNVYTGESGRANKRTVWTVPTTPFKDAHFATYPPELIRPCILAGSARGDTVLDPFSGSGTTGMVATQEGRRYVGIDVNAEYLDLSLRTRFAAPVLDMTGGAA